MLNLCSEVEKISILRSLFVDHCNYNQWKRTEQAWCITCYVNYIYQKRDKVNLQTLYKIWRVRGHPLWWFIWLLRKMMVFNSFWSKWKIDSSVPPGLLLLTQFLMRTYLFWLGSLVIPTYINLPKNFGALLFLLLPDHNIKISCVNNKMSILVWELQQLEMKRVVSGLGMGSFCETTKQQRPVPYGAPTLFLGYPTKTPVSLV